MKCPYCREDMIHDSRGKWFDCPDGCLILNLGRGGCVTEVGRVSEGDMVDWVAGLEMQGMKVVSEGWIVTFGDRESVV